MEENNEFIYPIKREQLLDRPSDKRYSVINNK